MVKLEEIIVPQDLVTGENLLNLTADTDKQ